MSASQTVFALSTPSVIYDHDFYMIIGYPRGFCPNVTIFFIIMPLVKPEYFVSYIIIYRMNGRV